jgi:hypothetical protein
MLLDELLRLVPRETKDRVDGTRERANLIVRECLRNETGLRLKRPAIEAVVNVRVRLVEGMPQTLAQRQIDEQHRVAALIAPWRHTLETLLRSGADTLNLYVALASDPWARALVKDADELPLELALERVRTLLDQTHGFNLTEWILNVDEDVLGIYRYRLPKAYQTTFDAPRPTRLGDPQIELYWAVIGLIALSLNITVEDLTVVVMAHELAHAFTHAGFDIDGETWNCSDFADSMIDVKEGLAQYYAWRFCERAQSTFPGARDAFEVLLKHQSAPYHAHEPWTKNNTPEQVRWAMLRSRRAGTVDVERFHEMLEEAEMLLGR